MRPPRHIADATADPHAERRYQYERQDCDAHGNSTYVDYPSPPPAAVEATGDPAAPFPFEGNLHLSLWER